MSAFSAVPQTLDCRFASDYLVETSHVLFPHGVQGFTGFPAYPCGLIFAPHPEVSAYTILAVIALELILPYKPVIIDLANLVKKCHFAI